jgi:fibronectin type 3 domain-containing protein|tara:strand:- start:2267 stop:2479 length:213 start_codon:yes stop_codon:yes gene_type:complete
MERDFNLRNAVWFAMILVSAGSVYGMMSQKVAAIETKQSQLETIIIKDIPEIKERVIRLEVLLEQALARK